MNKKALFGTVAGLAMAAAATPAMAINWIDVSSVTPTLATGTAGGVTITVDGPISTTYSVTNNSIWYYGDPAIPAATYLGSGLTALEDFIAFEATGSHTISFSSTVQNVYLALVSWNSPAGTTFSDNFTVVSQGNGAFGGVSSLVAGNVICPGGCAGAGAEQNGVIKFTGDFSSITFNDTGEAFHGFLVGYDSLSAVPEASTWAMMLAGFGMLGAAMRRRKADQRVRFNFG